MEELESVLCLVRSLSLLKDESESREVVEVLEVEFSDVVNLLDFAVVARLMPLLLCEDREPACLPGKSCQRKPANLHDEQD